MPKGIKNSTSVEKNRDAVFASLEPAELPFAKDTPLRRPCIWRPDGLSLLRLTPETFCLWQRIPGSPITVGKNTFGKNGTGPLGRWTDCSVRRQRFYLKKLVGCAGWRVRPGCWRSRPGSNGSRLKPFPKKRGNGAGTTGNGNGFRQKT